MSRTKHQRRPRSETMKTKRKKLNYTMRIECGKCWRVECECLETLRRKKEREAERERR